MTLKEFAERSWKAMYGEKTYEQVEQEFEEKRAASAEIILAELPYKPKDTSGERP